MEHLENPYGWLYYYRVSSREQRSKGHGLERYRDQGLALGLPPTNLYFDVESGGSATRPGLLEMCNRFESERGLLGLIVPYHSRLHRNQIVWSKIKKILLDNDLSYIDLRKGLYPIDLNNPGMEFDVELEAIISQRERRITQFVSHIGHINRRSKLRSMFAPFGYVVDPETRKLVPNTKEYRPGLTFWDAANQLMSWFLDDGLNMSSTVKKALEEWGECDIYRGRPKTQASLRGWLQNPALRGSFYNSHTNVTTPDTHTPLITNTQYQKISHRVKFPATAKSKPHRLAKLAFCSKCGSVMTRLVNNKKNTRYEYLYCRGAKPLPGKPKTCDRDRYIKYEIIENNVILALTNQAKIIGEQAAEIEPDGDTNPEIIKLTEEIKKLESFNDPDLAPSIDIKKAKLRTLLIDDDLPITEVDREMLAQYQADAADVEFWLTATDDERGVLYRQLIERIDVSASGEVDVTFTF